MADAAREELSALAAIFCGPDEWEVLSRSGDYPGEGGPGRPSSPPLGPGCLPQGPPSGTRLVEGWNGTPRDWRCVGAADRVRRPLQRGLCVGVHSAPQGTETAAPRPVRPAGRPPPHRHRHRPSAGPCASAGPWPRNALRPAFRAARVDFRSHLEKRPVLTPPI